MWASPGQARRCEAVAALLLRPKSGTGTRPTKPQLRSPGYTHGSCSEAAGCFFTPKEKVKNVGATGCCTDISDRGRRYGAAVVPLLRPNSGPQTRRWPNKSYAQQSHVQQLRRGRQPFFLHNRSEKGNACSTRRFNVLFTQPLCACFLAAHLLQKDRFQYAHQVEGGNDADQVHVFVHHG